MLRDDIARVAVKYLENEDLQMFMSQIDVIVSNYNISKSKNEITKYDGSQDDEIIKMFFVSKKIAGFSDRMVGEKFKIFPTILLLMLNIFW